MARERNPALATTAFPHRTLLVISQRFSFLVHFYGILRTEMEDCIVDWQVNVLCFQRVATPNHKPLSLALKDDYCSSNVVRSLQQRLCINPSFPQQPRAFDGVVDGTPPLGTPMKIMCQEERHRHKTLAPKAKGFFACWHRRGHSSGDFLANTHANSLQRKFEEFS